MDIRVSDDPAGAAAASIRRRIGDAIGRRGRACLAVSGGSTAPAMLNALGAADVDWDSVHIWQVDERVAPDGDEARNANQLGDLRGHIHLMPVAANDLDAAARRYAEALPDRFDVVHLGIGGDGHTASWPPDRPAVIEATEPVAIVDTYAGYRRMTLTPDVVNRARGRIVLAVGESKRPMVERWLLGDVRLPITTVALTRTTLFLDPDAAPRDVELS